MGWRGALQFILIAAVWFYFAVGPYASIYTQATDQIKAPVYVAFRSITNAFSDIWLLATNPTQWYARQQVINSRPEKPISFPKALEVSTLDVTPPSVPGGLPFVMNFVIKNEGDLPARRVAVKATCNVWCEVPPPIADIASQPFKLCEYTRIRKDYYCGSDCGVDAEIASGLSIDDCVQQCVIEGQKKTILTPMNIPVRNTCETDDVQLLIRSLQYTYWPRDGSSATLERGEAEIVTIEPFKANVAVGYEGETHIAKVSLNVSYEYSTASQLLVSVLGDVEKQRLIRERKLEFKPVVATAKVSPAKLSLNVGPQPVEAGKRVTLLVSVSNDRDQSRIQILDGTSIILQLPIDIGSALDCGQSVPIDLVTATGEVTINRAQAVAERLIYEVKADPKKGQVEIFPFEFNTIYTFLCSFEANPGIHDIKTGIITANLTSYRFVHTLVKDVPITTSVGVLFDPYESFCGSCTDGIMAKCLQNTCYEKSDNDTRDIGTCYYDSFFDVGDGRGGAPCRSCTDAPSCAQFFTEDACKSDAFARCGVVCKWNPTGLSRWHSLAIQGACEPDTAAAPATTIISACALTDTVSVTESQVISFLQSKMPTWETRNGRPSIFRGHEKAFYEIPRKYGVNPAFIAALGVLEGAAGTSNVAVCKNNPFGYGATNSCANQCSNTTGCAKSYATVEEAIEEVSKNVYNGWLSSKPRNAPQRTTLAQMSGSTATGPVYATDNKWPLSMAKLMTQLTGQQCSATEIPKVAAASFTKVELLGEATTKPALTEMDQKFQEMRLAMQNDIGKDLIIVSGYRDFNAQLVIWNDKFQGRRDVSDGHGGRILLPATMPADDKIDAIIQYSAVPGLSRHHWGTEIDINSVNEADWQSSCVGASCQGAVYNWLKANAATYGFCEPYDVDRTVKAEPWHWTYKPVSKQLTQQHLASITVTDIQGKGIAGETEISARFTNLQNELIANINPTCL